MKQFELQSRKIEIEFVINNNNRSIFLLVLAIPVLNVPILFVAAADLSVVLCSVSW